MYDAGDRISSGIDGLDRILNGGYPDGRIMLIEGAPGTGKTTLALQFLLAGAKRGKRALFVSVAQSRPEIEMIADAHGMDVSEIAVHAPDLTSAAEERVVSLDSEEADLFRLMQEVDRKIDDIRPEVFVFDSLLELRLLSRTQHEYRRELLVMRQKLRRSGATSLLIDHLEPEGGERNAEGVVHGVIKLDTLTPPIGKTHRRLTVVKMRGAAVTEGWHDVRIETGGLKVFPRVIPHEAGRAGLEGRLVPPHAALARLLGGGLEYGTTLLIAGQSGTGKSTIATLLARAAAEDCVPAAMFLFEERPEVLRSRAAGVGIDIETEEHEARLHVSHFDPAEVTPGEFSHLVLESVDAGARVVVIDSLTGYFEALPDWQHVMTHMHSLLQHLTRRGVLVIVTLSQHGLLGEPPVSRLDSSFLADSVILLRQYQAGSEIRRSIAVLKKRHSEHQRHIEELIIRPGAVEICPLSEDTADRARRAPQLGAE